MKRTDKVLAVIVVLVVISISGVFLFESYHANDEVSTPTPVSKSPGLDLSGYTKLVNASNAFGSGSCGVTINTTNGSIIGMIFGNGTTGDVCMYKSYNLSSSQKFCMNLCVSSTKHLAFNSDHNFVVVTGNFSAEHPHSYLFIDYNLKSNGKGANYHFEFFWKPDQPGGSS